LGYLFDRYKQPPVIGEIIAGIVLGTIGFAIFYGQDFNILNLTVKLPKLAFNTSEFELLAQLGILFLLFISGLETRISSLRKVGRSSSFVAVGGAFLPFIFGLFSGLYFNFSLQESIAIGLILIATSVGVTVRTLMDLHALNSDMGITILGSAVIDDIFGIILLALVLGIESPIWIGLKIIIYSLIFLYLGLKFIDKILDLGEKIHLPKAFLSISLSIFLVYSFFADKAGIAGIIGAFVAGLLIGQTVRSRSITNDVKTIGYGFFIPLFFVWIGSTIDVSAFSSIGLFAVVVIFISIIGKIVGCGLGAKFAGMSNRESLQVGVGMIPRMEMALIIVTSVISRGILIGQVANQILAITLLLTIVTTLITPFLIKTVYKKS
jgi:Kef-type K+ transport system membrane component KefB